MQSSPQLIDLVPLLAPRSRSERDALALASGVNLAAERATRWAQAGGLLVAVLAMLAIFLSGCTPATWAAVEGVGAVAKGAACAICQGGFPVETQAAAHAKALRAITDAIAALAAARDPAEVAAIRRELAASQERERALVARLLLLAAPRSVAPAVSQ